MLSECERLPFFASSFVQREELPFYAPLPFESEELQFVESICDCEEPLLHELLLSESQGPHSASHHESPSDQFVNMSFQA